MRQSHSIDVLFWTRISIVKFNDKPDRTETLNMFGSKTRSSNSTFYTELEIDREDKEPDLNKITECKSKGCMDAPCRRSDVLTDDAKEQQGFDGHSFRRIATFGGFSWFRPFIMSTGSSTEHVDNGGSNENSMEMPFVRVSRGVLEYRSSR